jgi:hypothetical protein
MPAYAWPLLLLSLAAAGGVICALDRLVGLIARW